MAPVRLPEPVLARPGPDSERQRHRPAVQHPAWRLLGAVCVDVLLPEPVVGGSVCRQLLALPYPPGYSRPEQASVAEELGRDADPGQADHQAALLLLGPDAR